MDFSDPTRFEPTTLSTQAILDIYNARSFRLRHYGPYPVASNLTMDDFDPPSRPPSRRS